MTRWLFGCLAVLPAGFVPPSAFALQSPAFADLIAIDVIDPQDTGFEASDEMYFWVISDGVMKCVVPDLGGIRGRQELRMRENFTQTIVFEIFEQAGSDPDCFVEHPYDRIAGSGGDLIRDAVSFAGWLKNPGGRNDDYLGSVAIAVSEDGISVANRVPWQERVPASPLPGSSDGPRACDASTDGPVTRTTDVHGYTLETCNRLVSVTSLEGQGRFQVEATIRGPSRYFWTDEPIYEFRLAFEVGNVPRGIAVPIGRRRDSARAEDPQGNDTDPENQRDDRPPLELPWPSPE